MVNLQRCPYCKEGARHKDNCILMKPMQKSANLGKSTTKELEECKLNKMEICLCDKPCKQRIVITYE